MAESISLSKYEELAESASKPIVLEFGADW